MPETYIPEPGYRIKASELAARLLKHPDAIVYVDYIPPDRDSNFTVEYREQNDELGNPEHFTLES